MFINSALVVAVEGPFVSVGSIGAVEYEKDVQPSDDRRTSVAEKLEENGWMELGRIRLVSLRRIRLS